jgi:hypothetical protein
MSVEPIFFYKQIGLSSRKQFYMQIPSNISGVAIDYTVRCVHLYQREDKLYPSATTIALSPQNEERVCRA